MRALLVMTGIVALSPLSAAQPQCSVASQVPVIRPEGRSELVGDLTLTCIGGTPTPAGEAVPKVTVLLSLPVSIMPNQAILLVDEPFSSVHPIRPLLSCSDEGAPKNDGTCGITSTGDPAATYDGTSCASMPPTFGYADLAAEFTNYYQSAPGLASRGAFQLRIPLSFTGDPSLLQSVTVTLTNSIGDSQPSLGSK